MSNLKPAILIILVCTGLALQLTGAVDLAELIDLGRQYSDRWWLAVALVLIQTALFTFALTGSAIVWLSAVLFAPGVSTVIITCGTTLGGIAAYLFSKHLSEDWTRKVTSSWIYQLMQQEGRFPTLFALRLMPGFPHSIINYSSGILKLKLIHFIPATVAGTIIKAYLYSTLIFNATTTDTVSGTVKLTSVWPLLALSSAILAVMLVKRFMRK